jgi:hypothetical protein
LCGRYRTASQTGVPVQLRRYRASAGSRLRRQRAVSGAPTVTLVVVALEWADGTTWLAESPRQNSH